MKGILFKPEMIKAIGERRKTVTRRLIKPQPVSHEGGWWSHQSKGITTSFQAGEITEEMVALSRYLPGEVVYVKEAWCEDSTGTVIHYKLDGGESPGPKVSFGKDKKWHPRKDQFWRSPMFLPEKGARYFLHIKSVRPERLQEITEADAVREGVCALSLMQSARMMYQRLWDEINDKVPWESNPWVWRIEFELVEKQGMERVKNGNYKTT